MKKTCNGCRALYMSMYEVKCEFEYQIDQKEIKLLEACPKPKSYKKW